MKVDYLLVGGGLSGSLLAKNLIKAGRSVLVVDDKSNFSASRVAGGIINPVTGMRLVKTWKIKELLAGALQTYQGLEAELGLNLVKQISILDFYISRDQKKMFEDKVAEGNEYLSTLVAQEPWQQFFNFHYDIGEIAQALLVDLRAVVDGVLEQINTMGCLSTERFNWEECVVETDKVTFRNIEARKIICCEGADGGGNPYFDLLPWSKDKGEVVIVSIPGLSRNHIFKNKLGIVPWQDKDLFWIGATHDWKYTDLNPTETYLNLVKDFLDEFLKVPYTIIDHLVARRPANLDRKPFAGFHPKYPAVGILNGMGGKGVSMAPYFARQFADNLINGTPIMPEADVCRFSRILNR